MLVVMRTGENAPTTEQVGETSAELRRLIRQETYLEEEASMESQVQRYYSGYYTQYGCKWDAAK